MKELKDLNLLGEKERRVSETKPAVEKKLIMRPVPTKSLFTRDEVKNKKAELFENQKEVIIDLLNPHLEQLSNFGKNSVEIEIDTDKILLSLAVDLLLESGWTSVTTNDNVITVKL